MKQSRFVGEYHTCHHRTCLPVDDSADGFYDSFFVVNRIIVQLQFHFRHVLQCVVHASVLAGQGQQLVFSHGEINIHIGIVAYCRQRLRYTRAHQCTCTVRQCAHNTIARTFHFRIREVIACIQFLRFGLCQLCFGREESVLSRLQTEV